MKTIIVLGSGFDIDLGLRNSCAEFAKSHYCPVVGNEYWNYFEKTLRDEVVEWYTSGKDEKKAKELCQLWQDYVKNISAFFTESSDKFTKTNLKCRRAKRARKTCAYNFLKRLKATSKSKIYTFNYTNPYEYVDMPQVKDLTHLHGVHCKDTFNKPLMVMLQGHNIILGIDECIPEDGINNPYIHPLVKKYHPKYKETDIITDLSNAENVIFYGFSMGVVDFSYFAEFFNAINNGCSRCKKIYFVTYNKKGLKDFIDNLKGVNWNVDNILPQKIIMPVYTSKGAKNKEFRMMLRRL